MSSPAVDGAPEREVASELLATPPPSSIQLAGGSPAVQGSTPQGAPPNGGALDELRRKMLFRQNGKAPTPMNVNGELQPHPPGSPGRTVSPGSGASIVGAGGALVQKNLNSSHDQPHEKKNGHNQNDAEQMRSALFQGRALPVRVISGGDLRGTDEQQTADPHKLFQLLRKKKRATPQSSTRPFVPYQPPVEDSGPRSKDQTIEGTAKTTSEGGNSPPVPSDAHNTPPRPSGSIPSRRPTLGRRPSSELGLQQHPGSAPAGSTSKGGDVIPPTAIVGPGTPGEVERPTSRVGSANALKREVSSAGLHGRPCTRQKHPKKSLDLFEAENGKAGTAKTVEDMFPKRRASSSSMHQASTPKAGVGPSPSAIVPNNGITTVPSPSHSKVAATAGVGDDEYDPNNASTASVNNALINEAKPDNVNFNCLFVQDEDEFGGEADAFPTKAPSKGGSNIPLIETDWFTTDSWEPLACSDGHEVLECDTEDYAESLYELLKQSSVQRKASFKK